MVTFTKNSSHSSSSNPIRESSHTDDGNITNMADERSGSGKSRRSGSAKSISTTVSKLTVRALQSLNLTEVEDANTPDGIQQDPETGMTMF